MKPLLRGEDFHPGRHIKVSSEHEDFGDRRRVVQDGDSWCTSSGNRFGEWVQVDLGNTGTETLFYFSLFVGGAIVTRDSIGSVLSD